MLVFWGAATIAFIVIEAATAASLTSIWFALGAICAFLVALLGGAIWLQVVWFVVVSAAAVILTRPLVKKYINGRTSKTNADRVIGMKAKVTEEIDNLSGKGAVYVDGKEWSAISESGDNIPVGVIVDVLSMRGVKLTVRPE